MELRHLRYFQAVAEELSFTRGAKRLGIAQPPLSSQIKLLEADLGVKLLSRSPQHVSLTPAGEVLLVEARRILGHVEDAVRATKLAGAGGVGQVKVGFIGSVAYDVLPRLLLALRRRAPGVHVALRQLPTGDQLRALATGAIQVGFVRGAVTDELGHIALASERVVVALPAGHRLAKRKRVSVASLAGEDLVLFPRALGPAMYDEIVRLHERAGLTPRVAQEANEMQTIVGLVSGGVGVAFVPEAVARLGRPGVAFRPLGGEGVGARIPLTLVWRKDDDSRALAVFLDVARHVIRGGPKA